MSDFLVYQWDFSATAPQPCAVQSVPPSVTAGHWYHCHREAEGLYEWLLANRVSHAAINSLLDKDTRPNFELINDDQWVLILRGLNLNENANPEDMLSLRILYLNGALISVRKTPSSTIEALQRSLQDKTGPADIKSLLLAMVNGLNRNIDNFLQSQEELIETFDDESELTQEMMQTHKALLKIKRFIKPQQYALSDLYEAEVPSLAQASIHLRQSLNTITRINETLDFYLTHLDIIKGELRQFHAEKMNQNTYLFSVIAAIFLPTSFLTGLLGVNVGGIPGADSPIAFGLFCLGLVFIFGFEIWFLRKLRMFDKE
ncbi:CorA family divalent cation transporter [Reinekea marinisedimentorum]|uniref:Zinc transporter n=1 Tax=Reinekea marinisedimentorum TaxID=230495 RepID=A0A4V2UJK3_9GAMM|nr:CorA family divalent cation transporter [Reinekea marinisedimentorum]TCS40428.1 zinc transporter [Reinekea marinisedimentorum]